MTPLLNDPGSRFDLFLISREKGKRKEERGKRKKETGNRKKERGKRKKETGNRKKERGKRKEESGKRREERGKRKLKKVSQNMVSFSEPSVNQTLDLRSIKHFRIA